MTKAFAPRNIKQFGLVVAIRSYPAERSPDQYVISELDDAHANLYGQ